MPHDNRSKEAGSHGRPGGATRRWRRGPAERVGDDDILLVAGYEGAGSMLFDMKSALRRDRGIVLSEDLEGRHTFTWRDGRGFESHGRLSVHRIQDPGGRQGCIESVGDELRRPGCQRNAEEVTGVSDGQIVRCDKTSRRELDRDPPPEERRHVAT